jgi:hypothetical protein
MDEGKACENEGEERANSNDGEKERRVIDSADDDCSCDRKFGHMKGFSRGQHEL